MNIAQCSEAQLIALLAQTQSVAVFRLQVTQELSRRYDGGCTLSMVPAQHDEPTHPVKIAFVKGRKLSEQEIENIDEDNFDIILDMTTNSLRFRRSPSGHSKLRQSNLEGIRIRRKEILVYLLEHPTQFISAENVSSLPNQCAIVESTALAKTISILRKMLGHSYIITEPSLGSSNCVYRLNPEWNYLVIKEKNEKSFISHR